MLIQDQIPRNQIILVLDHPGSFWDRIIPELIYSDVQNMHSVKLLPFCSFSSSYCSTFQRFSSLSSSRAVMRLLRVVRSGRPSPA